MSEPNDPSEPQASKATPPSRYPVEIANGMHPTLAPADQLLKHCNLRTQRRSGPGGQHRNKTSSGVFLTHTPSGVVAEATERRSQADNRGVALQRLRLKLAVEVRTRSIFDGPISDPEQAFRQLRSGRAMRGEATRLADTNPDKAPLLALLLNDLHACGGQPRLLAEPWQMTSTAIVRLVKSHPPALKLLQAIRQHHGLRTLS